MGAYGRLWSNAGTSIVVVDAGTPTGFYMLAPGLDLGNARWRHVYSGSRGTLGALPAAGIPENRDVVLPFRVSGDGDGDALATKINAAAAVIEDIRRTGGGFTWRPANASNAYRVHFRALDAGGDVDEWGLRAESLARTVWKALLTCAPLAEGDSLDVIETFDDPATITDGRWGQTGAPASLPTSWSVASGEAVAQVSAPSSWAYYQGRPLRDGQATIKFRTGATWATTSTISVEGRIYGTGGTAAWLMAHLSGASPGGMTLTLYSVTANGSGTASIGSIAAALAANSTYYLRLRAEGGKAFAEVFAGETEPGPMQTPTYTVNAAGVVLTAAQDAAHPFGRWGFGRFGANVAAAFPAVEAYTFNAFVYRNVQAPEVVQLPAGAGMGTFGPRFDLEVTPSGGAGTPVFARFAWWRKPLIHNACWNGDLDSSALAALGWSTAAVAGVIGGPSTAVSRDTTAARLKYGTGALRIQTPATTDTGAVFTIYDRAKAGRAWLAWGFVSSAAGTTAVRIKLGVSGDIATGGSVALTATPTLRSALWRPTADRDAVRLAIATNAATATDFTADAIGACETVATTLGAAVSSASATTGTVTTPLDLPPCSPEQPLYAVLSPNTTTPEIVEVIGVAGNVWTWRRGRMGTTATTHLIGADVALLPELELHRRGMGAASAFGVIEGESAYFLGGTNTWAVAASAGERGGFLLYDSSVNAGAGNSTAGYMIDGATIDPDDYTEGRVATMQVYARVLVGSTLDSPKITASLTFAGVANAQYSAEFGRRGAPILKPTTGQVWRHVFLGTFRVPTIPGQRAALILDYSWGVGTTAVATSQIGLDFLELIPARARASAPEGKTLDSTYPYFVFDTSEITRRFRSNGDGSTWQRSSASAFAPDTGLGGRKLELPASARGWEVLPRLGTTVPGDRSAPNSTETQVVHPLTLHVHDFTPRYGHVRAE